VKTAAGFDREYTMNDASRLRALLRVGEVLSRVLADGSGCDPVPDATPPDASRSQQICCAIIRATYLGGLLDCQGAAECCAAWNSWYSGAIAGCLLQTKDQP
jgi:hypothetical protein